MDKHELEIEILPDGTVRVEVFGVKGADCMQYAELMEKIVGMLQEKKVKNEFYEKPPTVRIHQDQKITENPNA